MLDAVLDLVPSELRGWFALSLPVSRGADERFGLSDLQQPGAERLPALRAVADRARAAGAEQVTGGELISAAVLHAVLRYLIGRFGLVERPGVLSAAIAAARADADVGLDQVLAAFARSFPPADGRSDADRGVVELWLLTLADANPALTGVKAVFEAPDLYTDAPTRAVVEAIESAFGAEPGEGTEAPLPALLRAPMQASPDDLAGQLDFVLRSWASVLPVALTGHLQRARDVLAEERRPRFSGPGPARPLSFAPAPEASKAPIAEPSDERFTPDRDWMSNVVLMAKLTHVWLHQLSQAYQRPITRLDQIPDAELDRLARWGCTGLWLIGLWSRSKASRTIKQKMGNPEALSSAYALYDYAIADDLGGADAYDDLRERAAARGIRMAGDMVPNHVGIDGRWVIEHPERFMQIDAAPYPNYRFTGPDLCDDARVGIYLEDGYWTRSDAAVVFKRVDHATGDVRYIYHGNDGTVMPWNDTAQLDYLNPEAREAVIQTILDVARRFSIIRFDAAMTLARRHVRRLWHPAPGEGGAIASRAERAISPAAFDAAMPAEFWREVVDRIQAEAPDTLLLAEAFWLMEGYFVRTLGMHRVYNSAFMHMLRDEDNAGYRRSLANTLAFSPAVLQRFVNFMNNPDEETAVEQFGKGDKYLGVATLLVTLPGLPMLGHGQVEGFAEKYGMEYRQAYKDEAPDAELIARHERLIFPLMRRRALFSDAEHFALFDFVNGAGIAEPNVYAYTNRADGERAVVLFNNAYASAEGSMRVSVPINIAQGGETELVTRTLSEALDLATDGTLYRYRDHVTGLEYLRSGATLAEHGLAASLPGYRTMVLLDWAEVPADDDWQALADALDGEGVPDLDLARGAREYAAVVDAWGALLDALLAESGQAAAWMRLDEAAGAAGWSVAALPAAVVTEPAMRDTRESESIEALVAGSLDPEARGAASSELELPEPDVGEPADPLTRVWWLVGGLQIIAPQHWALLRQRALASFEPADVALAEALAEGGALAIVGVGDAARISNAALVAQVSGPAARAWLDVHAYDGVDWFRGERMARWITAHRVELAGRVGDAAATVIEAQLRRWVEASGHDFDRLPTTETTA